MCIEEGTLPPWLSSQTVKPRLLASLLVSAWNSFASESEIVPLIDTYR